MSLRKAINEKCKECIYDPVAGRGTWRQQVEACTSPGCPLFPYRPMAEKSNEKSTGPQPAGLARYAEKQRKLLAKRAENER